MAQKGEKVMILMRIIATILIIGLILFILGIVVKKKIIKVIGMQLIILVIIACVCFFFYTLYEMEQEEKNQFGTSETNSYVKIPDRIIYKTNNSYYIISKGEEAFDLVCKEIFKRIDSVKDGEVLTEDRIKEIKKNESFVEFDYDRDSKNKIFLLENETIGMISMFSESGQISKNNLQNVNDLVKKLDRSVKGKDAYSMNDNTYYTSNNTIQTIPSGYNFSQKTSNIYHLLINNQNDYERFLKDFNFETSEKINKIDFSTQNVIITLYNSEIENIDCNIGNIKYKFSGVAELKFLKVNMLVVSKVVNERCIYDNVDKVVYEQIRNYEDLPTQISGIVKNNGNNILELGYTDTLLFASITIDKQTKITNYITNQEISLSDIKKGDSVIVIGKKVEPYNDLEKIEAQTISVYPIDELKKKVSFGLEDTYRIDGHGIVDTDVNLNGEGYIICDVGTDGYVYPIKLNVNSKTETYLGFSYHIQSNYGYLLHEMCWITMDTKIEDIDNIKGYVNMIEYIAD